VECEGFKDLCEPSLLGSTRRVCSTSLSQNSGRPWKIQETPRPTEFVEISPDGDLILIVGPEEAKLQVHSMLLVAVSKLFSVMFGLDWKEGHDMLDRDGPAELLLPEDNAAASVHPVDQPTYQCSTISFSLLVSQFRET